MQAIFGGRHQAIEKGSVEAVQVLERVGHSEAGAHVEVQLSVADRSEVDQNNVAVGLLQCDGGVDRGGGGSGSAFGAEKSKNTGFARASTGASAVGTEARKSFEQSLGTGGLVQIFPGSG